MRNRFREWLSKSESSFYKKHNAAGSRGMPGWRLPPLSKRLFSPLSNPSIITATTSAAPGLCDIYRLTLGGALHSIPPSGASLTSPGIEADLCKPSKKGGVTGEYQVRRFRRRREHRHLGLRPLSGAAERGDFTYIATTGLRGHRRPKAVLLRGASHPARRKNPIPKNPKTQEPQRPVATHHYRRPERRPADE